MIAFRRHPTAWCSPVALHHLDDVSEAHPPSLLTGAKNLFLAALGDLADLREVTTGQTTSDTAKNHKRVLPDRPFAASLSSFSVIGLLQSLRIVARHCPIVDCRCASEWQDKFNETYTANTPSDGHCPLWFWYNNYQGRKQGKHPCRQGSGLPLLQRLDRAFARQRVFGQL